MNVLSMQIVVVLARLDAIEPSLAVARALGLGERGSSLERVVCAMVRRGRYDEALPVADEIPDLQQGISFVSLSNPDEPLPGTPARQRARCAIAVGLAESGDTAQSLEIARGLTDTAARCRALAVVAMAASRCGDDELAVELTGESQSVLGLSESRRASSQAAPSALRLLIRARAWTAAEELAEREEAAPVAELVNALLAAGEHQRARRIIDRLPPANRAALLVDAAIAAPGTSGDEALAEAERICREIATVSSALTCCGRSRALSPQATPCMRRNCLTKQWTYSLPVGTGGGRRCIRIFMVRWFLPEYLTWHSPMRAAFLPERNLTGRSRCAVLTKRRWKQT